jgi:hypothetical protein
MGGRALDREIHGIGQKPEAHAPTPQWREGRPGGGDQGRVHHIQLAAQSPDIIRLE